MAAAFTASDFFDESFGERLYCPTQDGSSLPNIAYVSGEFDRLERERIFRRTWVFAGFAHRIANPGDMLPVEIAGSPLVLVRGRDGRIRAFHNACRHRGAKLVLQRIEGGRSIICPNHSWSYSLEGGLMARPHFHGGDRHDINKAACHRADLVPVRCGIWHDWIFVNLDGKAEELDVHLEPLIRQLDGYDFSALSFSESMEFDIRANWKLVIENFIEPYHVFSCHPWLNDFVGMAERTAPAFDRHVLMCGYDFRHTDPARGEGLPYFPGLPESRRKRGEWFVLFPNFAFEIFPDQVDVFVATPTGVAACRETIALYFIGEGATAPRYAEARDRVAENWKALNAEDIGIIERMQAGRYSEGFDGGVLSPYWDPVLQHFARLVYERIIEN
ncbi:MAG: aromatic ring-hydroxylating dioxygenase subunit alpha [Gammaproteobacteria bacterium]|nr:aromatic ring-hydroxylating dioxygenase subunit alpha [Gammaproteobacteria bacterium]MYD76119.1 aromatic ring-hydroxylating dioxygenase subunit alpha [Gammaproteobacteria bacterium]MYJ52159.1 aromatic ring-hydroxylating dioxygenase subunit alpha [Gammaproteobacteria bacterium]